jgi:hypothetical protein
MHFKLYFKQTNKQKHMAQSQIGVPNWYPKLVSQIGIPNWYLKLVQNWCAKLVCKIGVPKS